MPDFPKKGGHFCETCGMNFPAAVAAANWGNCPGCWQPLMPAAALESVEPTDASVVTFADQPENNSPEPRSASRNAYDSRLPDHKVHPPERTKSLLVNRTSFINRGGSAELPPNSTSTDRLDEIAALQINPVAGIFREMESITQLMNTLGSVAAPLIFELSGANQRRYLIVRCQRRNVPVVRGQLTGIYGSPEIIDITGKETDPARVFHNPGHHRHWARLGLEKSEALPIRTFREIAENDTILNLLSTLYGLEEAESGQIQIVVHGTARTDWATRYRQELLEIRRRRMGQITMLEYLQILSLVIGAAGIGTYFLAGNWWGFLWLLLLGIPLLVFGCEILFRRSGLEWSEAMEEAVARKIDQPGYRIEVRLAASGPSPERVDQLLRVMSGAFRVFSQESGNGFREMRSSGGFDPSTIEEGHGCTFILGDVELATIWHLPIEALPDMMQVKKFDHTLMDSSLYLTDGEERTFEVGVSKKDAGREITHKLPLDAIGYNSMVLLGQTGVGKSTFLEHAICAIAEDRERALVVIDPHSDMVERLIEILPASRVDDIIFMDFGAPDMLPALNLLDVALFDHDHEKTASAFFEVAKGLYGKYWGPRMEVPFEKTISALTLANTIRPSQKQFTLIDAIYLILMGKLSRKRYLEDILPDPGENVQSKAIINYFEYELDTRTQSFTDQVISPVLSKLRPFESNSQLLAVFGQPKSSINPIQAIQDGKILLIRTGMEDLDSGYSNFIGSVFLKLADEAVKSQKSIHRDLRRRVTIVVDESQQFPGYDFGLALSLHRKYGGNFMLTTQGVSFMGRARSSADQDRPNAYQEVMSNASTKVVFRLAGHDARVLTETDFFSEMEPQNLINLPAYHAFIHFAGEKVWGPFLVSTHPPREAVPGLRNAVLDRRSQYCLSKEELLASANQTMDAVLGRLSSDVFRKEDAKNLGRAQQTEESALAPIPVELAQRAAERHLIAATGVGNGLISPIQQSERDLAADAVIGNLHTIENQTGDLGHDDEQE